MPRPPRLIVPGLPHHVTQRGNYRQEVFYRDEDRQLYLEMLKEYSRQDGITIQAFCLMSNHVHLLVTPQNRADLPHLLQRLHSEHARSLHWRLQRAGHLWQARYGSVVLDEDHFWTAMVYIEHNPVRARLVDYAGAWRWSSAAAHLKGADESWLDFSAWRLRFDPEVLEAMLTVGFGGRPNCGTTSRSNSVRLAAWLGRVPGPVGARTSRQSSEGKTRTQSRGGRQLGN